MNSLYNKSYLLFGLGISNKKVKQFFDSNNIKYDVIDSYNLNANYHLKESYDYIVKSPSIKLDNSLFMKIKGKCISDLELYYYFYKERYKITITGSSAKSTVTTLISNLLNNPCKGNIGLSVFNYIDSNLDIIEASSYMLEATYLYRCNIYILTNIYENHLDHHDTFTNYLDSKLKVINNLLEDDYLIYDSSCIDIGKYKCKTIDINSDRISVNNRIVMVKSKTIYLDETEIYTYSFKDLLKMGNIKNLLFSIVTYLVYYKGEVDFEVLKKKVKSYFEEEKTIKYRLDLYEINSNLIVINDSKCTNMISLKNALDIVSEYGYQIYLIMGGQKRENHDIIEELKKLNLTKYRFIKEVYVYGEVKNSVYNYFNSISKEFKIEVIDIFNFNLNSIKTSKKGRSAILFSCAYPSLDLFENFEKRGEFFEKLVNFNLKKRKNL